MFDRRRVFDWLRELRADLPNIFRGLLVLGVVGSAIWVKFRYPRESNEAFSGFLKEGGVLCVVFGIIDGYLESSKNSGKNWSRRNVDVVTAGVFCLVVAVVIGGQ